LKIDRKEAERIATLAHLELDDAGLERMAGEMTKILGYIEMLTAIEVTASAAADTAPAPFRDDVARPSISREGVASNAPAFENGFFVVPAVIEGE
jgi:aspartyl-tRNA(Asn)/glutamyl-tRNA(Gln) amidotransferase subunit C